MSVARIIIGSATANISITQLMKTGPLWHVLTVLLALLMFREVCQMSASLKRYLLSPENWMEMLVRTWNL